jgi:hydroxymethylglutaryl-CoA lyase
MTATLPRFVEIHEEGPREGFQIEPPGFSVADRASLVEALADAGLSQIQVASFVSPKRVPQMADAPDLFARIAKRPGCKYTGLWLNELGFARARAVPQVDLAGTLYFYASDAFCRQNNGSCKDAFHASQSGWVQIYREAGLTVESAYVMTAFGCNLQGAVSEAQLEEVLRFIANIQNDQGIVVPKIYLADTVGWANPQSVRRRIALAQHILPQARIGLHLHDTRGIGMANALAALESGVDLFDASVAGLGGCPFSGHVYGSASGNICTEDLVFLCHEMGIETGVDLEKLIDAARLAERIIGRKLDGRLMHSGSLSAYRKGP